jgi:hypothetical protein
MHPDTISALASLHQRDLDMEASRASLARSVQKQPAMGRAWRIAAVPGRFLTMLAARVDSLRGRSVVSHVPAAIGPSKSQSRPPKPRA